jgi:hypothetical protein
MATKTLSIILSVIAAYLLFTQLSANMLMIWGFVAGWTIFAGEIMFKHVSGDSDYRINNNGMLWVEFASVTIIIACTFALASKILLA